MISAQKIIRLMGNTSNVVLENGITIDKLHGAVLVGKVKDCKLEWVENFENLPERGQKLLVRMLNARKTLMSFDVEFNIATQGIVIDKSKTEKK